MGMRLVLCAWIAAISLCLCQGASADGLVFQLPADGAWARYDFATTGTQSGGESKLDIDIKGTLTLSSVGTVSRNQHTCRWIELHSKSDTEGAYQKLILKMLIPEKRLTRGQDPLAHSVLTFFDPKQVDEQAAPGVESFIDDGFNRIQYEIDRFRLEFPRPLFNAKSLPRETLETPAGRFEDCEVLEGMSNYDGPLLENGRSVFRSTYRIAIHPRTPFGVVTMQIRTEGREIGDGFAQNFKATKTLTLAAVGTGAVSALPKASKKPPQPAEE
jgi:hypothetical protein